MMRGIVAQNQEVLQIAFLSFFRAYCKHWNPHKQRVRTKPRRRNTAPFSLFATLPDFLERVSPNQGVFPSGSLRRSFDKLDRGISSRVQEAKLAA